MSLNLMEKPIFTTSAKVWDIPSKKGKYLILGNQHDDLEYDVVALIRIVPKKGTPIVFSAKIQKKKNGVSVKSFVKFILVPKNILPFLPQDIKIIDVELLILNKKYI